MRQNPPPSMKDEMARLGISEETMNSMKRFFMKTSVPRFIEENRRAKAEAEAQEQRKGVTT